MSTTLYIDGLLTSIPRPELEAMFSTHGRVLSTDIRHAYTVESVSIGTVEMETLDGAVKAVRALHRSYLGGKLLLVFR